MSTLKSSTEPKEVKPLRTKKSKGESSATKMAATKAVQKTVPVKSVSKKNQSTSKTKKSAVQSTVIQVPIEKKEVAKIEAKKTTKALLILSPWRFPLDMDKVAQQTARFAGVFFVILGAMFTLWHANAFLGDLGTALTAQLSTSVNTTSVGSGSGTSGSGSGATTSSRVTNTTEALSFSLPDPIKGESVQVGLVFAKAPEKAILRAKSQATGEVTSVANFSHQSGSTWKATFDSTTLKNGAYSFAVLAEYADSTGGRYSATVSDVTTHEIRNVSDTNAVDSTVSTTASSSNTNPVNDSSATGMDTGTSTSAAAASVATTASTPEITTNPFTTTEDDALDPEIIVVLPSTEALGGTINAVIRVRPATYIEMYAVQSNSATQKYLGLPKKLNDSAWSYSWNTKDVPNGNYRLLVKVRTAYGFFTAMSNEVTVFNQITIPETEEQQTYRQQVQSVAEDPDMPPTFWSVSPAVDISEDQLDHAIASTTESGENTTAHPDNLTEALAGRQIDFEKSFQILATAHRSGDAAAIETARQSINALTEEVKATELQADLADELDAYIAEVIGRVPQDVEKTNQIIAERTQMAAQTDADRDGIPDFDEIALYQTNPNVADTDGDGFVDGVEILSGYDPLDSTPEVVVAYESPREVGIVREDVLAVHSITTETFPGDSTETDATEEPIAVITGKGLPNSYVTLYIFSTPVVVTVRTDSDGAWVYRFDKELEDGSHQVYVGITDNAGRIVAKSNPLPFVKEAEAYTQVTEPASGVVTGAMTDTEETRPTLALLLVASISVVAIGLVLLVLGLHMQHRPRLVISDETPLT